MHTPENARADRGRGIDAPWSATAGGLLLAGASLAALSLQGTTYGCPGPPRCARFVMFPPGGRWLLGGLAAWSLGLAVGARRIPPSNGVVAATGALAVLAAGLAAYWAAAYAGPLGALRSVATPVAAAGAAALLARAAYREWAASGGRQTR